MRFLPVSRNIILVELADLGETLDLFEIAQRAADRRCRGDRPGGPNPDDHLPPRDG